MTLEALRYALLGVSAYRNIVEGPLMKEGSALLEAIAKQGRQRKAEGEYIPDEDWEKKLPRFFSEDGYCLTPEGLEFSYPQCSIAPAAEGTPVFQVPLSPSPR